MTRPIFKEFVKSRRDIIEIDMTNPPTSYTCLIVTYYSSPVRITGNFLWLEKVLHCYIALLKISNLKNYR